ncbi:MAG: tetratricopeptide repeat protein [Actinobacteria bacterium]|nr:tetratricopeptide repeat protein [Actinomycetota bacterium]
MGETIQDRLDPVTRAEVHQRLAEALESTGGPADELARHRAASGDTRGAAAAFATAAAIRLDRFADNEARQLASDGIAIGADEPEVRSTLLEVRAETYARQGDFEAARRDLRDALVDATSRPARSRLLTRMAALTAGVEDMVRAGELADLATAEAADDPGARARAVYVRALVDMNLDLHDAAEARFEEALQLFTTAGDTAGVADILDARAMSAFGFGQITEGIERFERVAKLFADNGNLLRIVTPRSTRGHGLLFAGRAEEGLLETADALELARSLGYAEGEAMVLWHHSEVLAGCGRAEEARSVATAGVELARRVQHRGWTASTLCGLGVVEIARGDLEAAATAFADSLALTEHLVMFKCWAHARLAGVLLAQDRLVEAEAHVRWALESGPGLLGQYEARLARCELAVRRGDDDAETLVDEALRLARAGGHVLSADRLAELGRQV